MQALIIILLGLLQFSAGFGILILLKIYLKPAFCISLSVLIGIAVFAIVPFLLQLIHIPLISFTVFVSIAIACILFYLKSINKFLEFLNTFKNYHFLFKLYKFPFILLLTFIFFVFLWR